MLQPLILLLNACLNLTDASSGPPGAGGLAESRVMSAGMRESGAAPAGIALVEEATVCRAATALREARLRAEAVGTAIDRCRHDVQSAMRCADGMTDDWAFFMSEEDLARLRDSVRDLRQAAAGLVEARRDAREIEARPAVCTAAAQELTREIRSSVAALTLCREHRDWSDQVGRLPDNERNRHQKIRSLGGNRHEIQIPGVGSLEVPRDQSFMNWRKGDPVRVARRIHESGGCTHLVRNLRTGAWIQARR